MLGVEIDEIQGVGKKVTVMKALKANMFQIPYAAMWIRIQCMHRMHKWDNDDAIATVLPNKLGKETNMAIIADRKENIEK